MTLILDSYDILCMNMELSEMKNTIKKLMSSLIFKRTKRRPMIFTLVFMSGEEGTND